ncbi:hydroxyacid dehydrogenase [Kribbella caucasensis]|nr:hydroxyacid dehydrogenase [Kribbella sp. VKM Ac-2527]
MSDRPMALFALSSEHFDALFPAEVRQRIGAVAEIDTELVVERFDDPRLAGRLAELEVLITGWGCPPLTEDFLAAAPKLRAVLHAAGSVKAHVTQAAWDRGIVVSSAAAANAIPVAEYALATIILAGKGVFTLRESFRVDRTFKLGHIHPGIGNHGRRVGIIGASRIGRQVLELLRPFDFKVQVHDPYAEGLDIPLVSLPELLSTSDIVSVHAPSTPQTYRMIDREGLALLRDGAVLINTARGDLVDTEALVGELRTGRISAVLDVTDPEPLPSASILYDLPNAFLTPHVAGSHGNELARLGECAAEELERLVAGLSLRYQVTTTDLDRVA